MPDPSNSTLANEPTHEYSAGNAVALCVDLDGTLLRTDLLYESMLALLARNPLYIFLLPFWLLRGKAALKAEISERVSLSVDTLPYDERVVRLVREAANRPRVLCTASDARLANEVSTHLGLFEHVLASDGQSNLSGRNKAKALLEAFGQRKFDYVGNDSVDLHVWKHARKGWLVNGPTHLARQLEANCELVDYWPQQNGGLRAWLKAIRLHQWIKNLLVFVPLLASHRVLEPAAAGAATLAFLAFGLCASGVYLLNDLLDLTADRMHPRKRHRPFAAGTLPLSLGILAAPLLTLVGFALAWLCNPKFALVLGVYYVATLAYSLRLKRIVMVDVMLLAGLYTLRIIGGAVAIGSPLSFWLLAFSMFLFLSLAMLKRYTELSVMLANGKDSANGRGYEVADLPLLQSLGTSSGYIAVLVLALYINSPESLELYSRPELIWLICPLALYWISRAWVAAHRNAMDDDPIIFAVKDRTSQLAGLIAAAVIYAAI